MEDSKIFSAALAKGNMGTGEADDLKALEIGMKMETKSIEFYQRLAKQAHDPMERRFLISLVNQERGHYNYLADYRIWWTRRTGIISKRWATWTAPKGSAGSRGSHYHRFGNRGPIPAAGFAGGGG